MSNRGKSRLLRALQVVAIPVFIGCGISSINSLASIPRETAEARLGRDLPDDWERVVINHNAPERWHGSRLLTAASFAGGAASGIYLLASGLYFRRKKGSVGLS